MISCWLLLQHPDLSDVQVPMSEKNFKGYYKISRHYKWGLSYIFNKEKYKAVIIVEGLCPFIPLFSLFDLI